MLPSHEFLDRIRNAVADALRQGVLRGIGLSWTIPIAGYAIYQAFQMGDLAQIGAFFASIGTGLIGDTLRDWTVRGQQPSQAAIRKLLEEGLADQERTEPVLAAMEQHLRLLETVLYNVEPEQLVHLLTAKELETQIKLFGLTLGESFKQLMVEQQQHLDARIDDHEQHVDRRFDALAACIEKALAAAHDSSDTQGFDQRGQTVGTQHNFFYSEGRQPLRRDERPLWAGVPPPQGIALLGRAPLLETIVRDLTSNETTVLALEGPIGTGKTALAIAAVYHAQTKACYPGGVLWADVGRSPNLGRIFNRWADELRINLGALSRREKRRRRIARELANSPVLVVLDDVWDVAAARALRLPCPNVVHFITTHNRNVAAEFAGAAHTHTVRDLDLDAALDLLRRRAQAACDANPEAARQIVTAVGGQPLALVLLGSYLAELGVNYFPEQQAFKDAVNAGMRVVLDNACPDAGGSHAQLSLAQVIQLSLDGLHASTRATFYALGAFAPKPSTFDAAAANAVAGAGSQQLAQLIDRNLLELHDDTTLSIHPIFAGLACARTQRKYHVAHASYYGDAVAADPNDWKRIDALHDQTIHAMRQFAPSDGRLVRWTTNLNTYWRRRGLWQEHYEWHRLAWHAAEASGDLEAQDQIVHNLATVLKLRGNLRQALALFEQSLDLSRRRGDSAGQATTLNSIALLKIELHAVDEGLQHYDQALELCRQSGDLPTEAAILHNIGEVRAAQGNYRDALSHYAQCLTLHRQLDDRAGEAADLNSIGFVYAQQGDHSTALAHYVDALSLRCATGDRVGESVTRKNIAVSALASGDRDRAIAEFENIVLLDEAMDLPDLEGDRNWLAQLHSLRTPTSTPRQR